MIKDSIRKCPICNNTKATVLHKQNFKLNAKSILPSSYDVVACEECGFCYADTSADQNIYNQYYSEFSKYEDQNTSASSGGGNSVWDKNRLITTAKDIEKIIEKDAQILDIGCANGGLLFELKNLGFKNVNGLDPSKSCVNYVNQKGVHCYLGELFTAEKILKDAKFDFIILSHVLEHICDLNNAVAKIRSLLTEKGQIYIEVPDASNYSNYFIVPYYYFDTEHINHFDSDSLKNLFESHKMKEVVRQNKEFSVNETTKYPATYSVFKKSELASPIKYSDIVKQQIERFITLSKENNSTVLIDNLAKQQQAIVIFGAGNFTARLLEDTNLAKCNIIAYVDNDTVKHGNEFENKKVNHPNYLKTFNGTVVICSAIYSEQIKSQILNELKIKNEIIILK